MDVQTPPVEKVAWPGNSRGIRKLTVPTIAKFVRRGIHDPRVRARAGQVLRDAGFPESIRARAEALRQHVAKVMAYAPDPLLAELVAAADVSLCLDGSMCMPIGDCDDSCVAVLALIGAAGMEARIMLLDYGGGAQAHVMGAVKDENGTVLEVDVTTDYGTGHSSSARSKTLVDPFDPKMMETGELVDGAFIGVGRPGVESPRMDPALRMLGTGVTTPTDVLSYRALWDPYVTQTACAEFVQAWACGVLASGGVVSTIDLAAVPCAAPWAAQVSGPSIFDVSTFATPPTAATLQAYGTAASDKATGLMTDWNLYAGLTDEQIVLAAPTILRSFQSTVRRAGQVDRPALVAQSPGLAAAIAQGPTQDAQAQLVAGIEGARILAAGVVQIAEIGADGTIGAYTDLATYTKKVAERVGTVVISPWLWVSIAVVTASVAAGAVAYVAHDSGVLRRVAAREMPRLGRKRRRRRR